MILRRRAQDRFSEVIREWEGRTAVIFGGGPSLTLDQVGMVGRAFDAGKVHAIAVNDTYLWAPWAEVLYAADSQWWAWQEVGTPRPLVGITAEEARIRFNSFLGQKCSIQYSGANIKQDDVHILRNFAYPNHGVGISTDQGALITARNSGFQALNLAILAGAKKVILLGIDGKAGEDGRRHWFGDHPKATPTNVVYEAMRKGFSSAEKQINELGVVVLNCSPGSLIDSFPKVALQEAI